MLKHFSRISTNITQSTTQLDQKLQGGLTEDAD